MTKKSNSTYIDIENLSLKYQVKTSKGIIDLDICNRLFLRFNPGEIVGILGPNGSGKSTLINALLGLKKPELGQIKFEGFKDLVQPRISFIPQDYKRSFFNWASLLNNLRFIIPDFYQNLKSAKSLIEKTKHELGIDLDLSLRPNNCSGGMLQQAAIIRAFAAHEGVILADEPFSALDVEIAKKIRANFRKKVIDENIISIVILHNIDDILSICDKVLVIPNKPYSTEKIEQYFQINIFDNQHLTDYNDEDNVNSILTTAENIFGQNSKL